MKTVILFFAAILLITIAGCGNSRQPDNGAFITVDVTASYPKKEFVLQDLMDVEYIALESRDEFLCQGIVQAAGKEHIVVTNTAMVGDGDVFIFDRSGKGLRKFNHQGKGGEEYMHIRHVILDEERREIYINDYFTRKVVVYDLFGVYQRSFNWEEGFSYDSMCDFDAEHLICTGAPRHYESNNPEFSPKQPDKPSFVIVSKKDGSIVREVAIDFEQAQPTQIVHVGGGGINVYQMKIFSVIPYHHSWILTEPSSDTIYHYLPDNSMKPFMARTPSIQSMNTKKFLFPGTLTGRYAFVKVVDKEEPRSGWNGFPETRLVCDREENAIYECTVTNGDYSIDKPIDMMQTPVSAEIAFQQKIEADELFEAAEKGQLKGRLKEIAESLEEESNPVIMLVKHKK